MDKLIKNPFSNFEDKLDPEIPTGTHQIYSFIEDYFVELNGTANRCSAATMCVKRRWYQNQGYKGEPLTPRKRVNFMLGDLAEKTLLFFISQGCVGPGKLYSEVDFGEAIGSFTFNGKEIVVYEQAELHLKIGELEITGHPDGWGKRNSDGQWELIEIKSAADYGYKDFQENGAGDYLKQAHAQMMTDEAIARGVKSVRFFYLKKQTGNVWDRLHQFDEETAQLVRDEFVIAAGEKEPKAPHELEVEKIGQGRGKPKKETGRLCAGFPCSYCGYLRQCKGEFTVEFNKGWDGTTRPKQVFNKEK